MKKKFVFALVLVLLVTFVLAACTPAPEPTAAPVVEEPVEEEPVVEEPVEEEPVEEEPVEEEAMEPTTVKVGLITDQTGGLAIYGTMMQRGFLNGLEYALGVAPEVVSENSEYVFSTDEWVIEVYIKDDQSNAETTATVARELIDVEGVSVLVGTVSSGATATLQELARENELPLIVAPAAANDITGINFNEYTFRTSRNNYQDAVNLCQYLVEDYSTFVQIAPDYSFGYGGADAFRDACSLYGGEFVADDIYAPADTTEFTPYMEEILASGAEAYLVTWAGSGFISLQQAAADLGVNDQMAMGSAFIDNALMPVFFGNNVGATSGILYHYSAPDNAINDWLVEKTLADASVPPDLFDADGMNAALLLVYGLTNAEELSTDGLIAAMEGAEFEGPKGTIYIRPEDHVAIQDMYIVTLENLDSPDFDFYTLVATNRPDVPCLLEGDYVDRCGELPVGSLSGE